jgi:hypothetical protein
VGLKTPNIPKIFLIDGNRRNTIVNNLQGEDINRRLGPLQFFLQSLPLSQRNNGCSLGQIGEYSFRKEKELGGRSPVLNALKFSEPTEINALVFAGGGGFGSGAAAVLNEERRYKHSLLINMMVLPPYHVSDRRQMWNTGRCIMRLANINKQTALLLFSNRSESLNDQTCVNQYISKLVVRLANFEYSGNVPKVATDIDRKDLQAFFSGGPAFVAMSNLNQDKPSKEEIEQMVDQALASRRQQNLEEDEIIEENIFGLSIEVPEVLEKMMLRQIKMVMIVIGLTSKYEGKVNIVDIAKRRVAEQLGANLDSLDCRAYCYTSPSEIELTIFCRHSSYRSNFLLDYFLKSYFEWYDGEKTEFEYLNKILREADNEFLGSLRSALQEAVEGNNPD